MTNPTKTVLITGCSSGFGKLTARLFHEKGWNVFATMRAPEKETELTALEHVRVFRLDVTNPQSVAEAVATCLAEFGRIDVLVNNAGISGVGVFEQWEEADIRRLFETDVFGLMRVTKAVLPVMRQQGTGAIVNISSTSGLFGTPYSSVYSAAKFAVEGLTEALALEYAPFGISVKSIAPGSYQTNLYSSIEDGLLANGDAQIRDYSARLSDQMNAVVAQMAQESGQLSDPREVAIKVYECATRETPIHNTAGKDANGLVQMKRASSEREMAAIISGMLIPADFTPPQDGRGPVIAPMSDKTRIMLNLFVPQRRKPAPAHAIPAADRDMTGKTVVLTGGTAGTARVAAGQLCEM